MSQILIVHYEEEIGRGLQVMVQQHSGHAVARVTSGEAALRWAQQAAECQLLITQLDSDGVDGFALAGSLGERFPQLHTFFLPGYPLAAQPFEVARSKVFPEPIEGERLLQTIESSTAGPITPDLFHLIDLLQMCCLSGKSGAFQLVADSRETGVVFLQNGELRDAATNDARGLAALGQILRCGPVEFAYDPQATTDEQTIDVSWDAALVEVVLREKEEKALAPGLNAPPEISASFLPPEPDLSGAQFGTYQVYRKLSESFWDQIYQADQTTIGRPVALHVLRQSLGGQPERAREFLETASANANLRHPAILPVYEAGEIDGT